MNLPPHAPPQAVPVVHAPPPPVGFDAPASIPHQHGLAETWDLVEERDVTDSFQSLRVEAHHHIGRQAFGVPGAVGESVFCPETNCRVPVQYAHCHDCLVPHCKFKFRFLLIADDANKTLLIQSSGVYLGGGTSHAGIIKRRRYLVEQAAKDVLVKPSVLVSNMVIDPTMQTQKSTIPKARQISQKRAKTSAAATAEQPGESPEELQHIARGLTRPDKPDAAQLWVDWENCNITETETCVPITCDWLLNNFAKFVMKGTLVYQGKQRFLKLVGDFTHQQTNMSSTKVAWVLVAHTIGTVNGGALLFRRCTSCATRKPK